MCVKWLNASLLHFWRWKVAIVKPCHQDCPGCVHSGFRGKESLPRLWCVEALDLGMKPIYNSWDWFARTGGISADTNFVLHLTSHFWTCIECPLSLQDEKVPKWHRSGENQATVFFWLVSHTSSVTISCRQEKTWLCKKHRSCYLDSDVITERHKAGFSTLRCDC